jgi:hypothetical protein
MLEIIEKIGPLVLAFLRKKYAIRTELEGLQHRLQMITVCNNLDEVLRAFQDFFSRNPKVAALPENRLFVMRYLMDPTWQAWGSVAGMWTKERWDQLHSDCAALRAA